jgi:minimal PKS acyl carrier protein
MQMNDMRPFTIDDMRRIMRGAGGGDAGDAVEDATFDELGYDSLALLEIQRRLSRELGIKVPENAAEEMPTPAAAVSYVNALLAGAEQGE